ncbi:hypothetical protein GWI33_007972 [Rhynchophorus ferrugineus]|uniref:Uncharacterized protein n=1 Tax=Rhynchophorus ferrugineus TaxID=354439 RepID=A0A834ICM0_RHYFE|nr:hypothetical protein GWI33_007972 [Rhynchophorus ferrugineus]
MGFYCSLINVRKRVIDNRNGSVTDEEITTERGADDDGPRGRGAPGGKKPPPLLLLPSMGCKQSGNELINGDRRLESIPRQIC